MGKRPLGLAKAAKLKKQKPEQEEKPLDSTESKQEADLNIELDESIDDEELAEIYGLFKTFDESSKTDPKMALGLVNECDGLLRERKKAPAHFHLCYGLALLFIASHQDNSEDVAEGETPEDFIDAAIDRFDVGIEEDKSYSSLKAAKATALVAKLDEKCRKTSGSKSRAKVARENISLLTDAQKLVDEISKDCDSYRLAEAVSAIHQFALSLEALPKMAKVSAQSVEWTNKFWESIAKSSNLRAQKLAWQGLGEQYLAQGQEQVLELLGADDDDDSDGEDEEDEDDDGDIDIDPEQAEKVKDLLTNAIEYLSKVQSDANPTNYLKIAEAKISIGNITKNKSTEQTQLYKEAIKLLKKAQRLGAGEFNDLIESLED